MKKRQVKTKKGIDRRLSRWNQIPVKRKRPMHHMTAAQKLSAKKYRIRLKKRLRPQDIKLDKLRRQFIRKTRQRRTGSTTHKLSIPSKLGVSGAAAGLAYGAHKIGERKGRKAGIEEAASSYQRMQHLNAKKAAASRAKNRASKKKASSLGDLDRIETADKHPLKLKTVAKIGGAAALYGVGRHHGHQDNRRY